MTKSMKSGRARRSKRSEADDQQPDLMDYAAAARFLGLKKHTLQNWISSGIYRLPFVKLGGRVRFRRASLLRWLDSREQGAESLPQPPAAQIEAR